MLKILRSGMDDLKPPAVEGKWNPGRRSYVTWLDTLGPLRAPRTFIHHVYILESFSPYVGLV